jgi:hypothetical protein
MALIHSPRTVTDGLILALDAGNTKSYPGSGTSWTDLSGQGNTGTLTNGPTYSSADGGSIVFDGSNDYGSLSSLNLSTLMNGSNNFSLSLWFNTDSFPATTSFLVSPVLFWAGNRAIYFVFGDSAPADQFSVRVNQNSTWQSPVQNNSTLSTGTWYNMLVTYNSSSGYILYQNGTSVDTSSTTGSISSFNDLNPQIGSLTIQGTRYYDGKISQILIYNKALTASEVQQNYNSLKGRYI